MKEEKKMPYEEMKETSHAEPAAEAEEKKEPTEESPAERDFDREIRELIEAYPELSGKSLPDEVVMAALDGVSLLEAYEAYQNDRLPAKNDRREKDLGVERQNENAAVRAPVRGVSGGAAVYARGEDDFLRGFNADN